MATYTTNVQDDNSPACTSAGSFGTVGPSSVIQLTSTLIEFTDPSGDITRYTGTFSYTYSGGYQYLSWPGSTLTGISVYMSGGALLGSIASMNVDGNVFQTYANNNDVSGLVAYMLRGNDTFTGSSYADVLWGYDGNDTIDGGLGADTLVGGQGDDTYVVDDQGDLVTEQASQGTDTVKSSITYTLGNNVESLTLTGIAVIDGTGNDLNNALIGNDAANILDGGLGADTMAGELGDDALYGGADNDTLDGGSGNDILDGGSGNDILDGGNGNDTLNGGLGADTMVGGLGDDIYVVDNTGDVVAELSANPGNDTVQSSITYTLGKYLESLTLIGLAAIDGTGNDLSNILTGNDAANILDGGLGADTMVGGLGDDIYIVDSTEDVVTEQVGQGTDTVQSSVSYSLGANVENLVLAGAAAIDGTGNAENNILIGNAANNFLDGMAGNDTLYGGAGSDVLVSHSLGAAGNDTLFGGDGDDILYVGNSTSTDSVVVDGGTGDDLIQIDLATGSSRTLLATGGAGTDTYQFMTGANTASYTVTDFTAGDGGDRINVTALLNYSTTNGGYTSGSNPFDVANGYLRITQHGADTWLENDEDGAMGNAYSFHTAMVLQNVTAAALTAYNFADSFSPDGSNIPANTAPSFTIGDGKLTSLDGYGSSATIQPDGKILVTGSSYILPYGSDYGLMRYNADGSPDYGFGTNGTVTTNFGALYSNAQCVAIQADGKILVAGQNSLDFASSDFSLARYNTDGSLDSSFGVDGRVTADFGGGVDLARSITVQADGKILVMGSSALVNEFNLAAARYNPDGSLDTSFGTNGAATAIFGARNAIASTVTMNSVLQQVDGKILVAGGSNGDFCLIRYNADLSPDSSFGTSGKVTTDFGLGLDDVGHCISVQADGKVLVAGHGLRGGINYDFAIARYNTDGSLDASFNGDGKVTTDLGGNPDGCYSVTVQADGKILAAGRQGGSNYLINDFAIVRYNTDGSLDTSFDGDGKVTTSFGASSSSIISSITVQTDGKILVSGTSNGNFALARYNTDGSLDTSFDPGNTLNGAPTFTKNGAAAVLSSGVQVYDAELAAANSYAGASLTLARDGGANSQDVFSNSGTLDVLTEGGNLTVDGITIGTVTTNSGGTLTLNFNSTATQTLVNSAMQQIAYSNIAYAPPASVQIDWTFSDGNSGAQGTGNALVVTGGTTVNIINLNHAPTGTVVFAGDAAFGQTLSVSSSLADADGLGAFNYQWLANGVAIAGATGSTYGLTQADIGKAISVNVSYTDLRGTAEAVSSSSSIVSHTPKATSSYFVVQSPGDNLLDFSRAYGALSQQGENIAFTGSSGVDNVIMSPGMKLDLTKSNGGIDNLFLQGNLADYTVTVTSASILTLSRGVGSGAEIVVLAKGTALNHDNVIFANGMASTFDLWASGTGAALSAAPAAPTALNATVKAFALHAGGETFAPSPAGGNLIATGGSGADVVYVQAGSTVDATRLNGGADKIYFTGYWSDYSKTATSSKITFTNSATGESVSVAASTGASNDQLIFADGTVLSNDAKAAIQADSGVAISSVTGYSLSEVTPLAGEVFTGTTGAEVLTGTAADNVIYGNGGADIISGGVGNDTIVIADAGVTGLNSATVVFTATTEGRDTILGFSAAPVAAGGDVLDFSAIAGLTASVATGQTLATDFAADNVFIFDGTPVAIADAAAAIAADVSVVATDGYIVIADAANHNVVTVYHSANLDANGATIALATLPGVDINSLTAANFLV